MVKIEKAMGKKLILYFYIDLPRQNFDRKYGDNYQSKVGSPGNTSGETNTSGGNEMKSFASLFMSLVLTAAMLTGCGCTNRNMDVTTAPTMLPTIDTTPSTAATEMPTVPTNDATHNTDETINHGNGPLTEDGTATTDSTVESTVEGRARQNTPIR